MPRSAASGLGQHCLPMSNKKEAMLIWVNFWIRILFMGMPDRPG